ncbi:MAG: DNA/RNA nuclease SfsA [Deltaproteobacteria bacterium]|nr:DNA/RNA nuclease SfsA [Deltaproteobacteria bacterium]
MGTFVARRQRFLADVLLPDGTPAVAHCPNTGSMKGCLFPGHPVLLWDSRNPLRKCRYTWKAVDAGGFWVGVDTGLPNRFVEAAVRAGAVPGLRGFPTVRPEQRCGARSRIDLLLEGPGGRCFVEVKNVTLVEGGAARFPDAVTARGLRHLTELTAAVAAGDRAAMVYVVQRCDARRFEPAREIDPAYARGLEAAVRAGVEAHALLARVSTEGVEFAGVLPIAL